MIGALLGGPLESATQGAATQAVLYFCYILAIASQLERQSWAVYGTGKAACALLSNIIDKMLWPCSRLQLVSCLRWCAANTLHTAFLSHQGWADCTSEAWHATTLTRCVHGARQSLAPLRPCPSSEAHTRLHSPIMIWLIMIFAWHAATLARCTRSLAHRAATPCADATTGPMPPQGSPCRCHHRALLYVHAPHPGRG